MSLSASSNWSQEWPALRTSDAEELLNSELKSIVEKASLKTFTKFFKALGSFTDDVFLTLSAYDRWLQMLLRMAASGGQI